ncbi:hypothetical protein CC78DRAFT_92759 [Lojkania enalia]|uniref:Uncharacterized protein n=1 Tax=Lojkania enalia TaxID=147567 RepID=A0A9P4KDG0_9PLEO|nr:hypothetical protein CC78DRAFT_92759 [Didymosphaeria enalia]
MILASSHHFTPGAFQLDTLVSTCVTIHKTLPWRRGINGCSPIARLGRALQNHEEILISNSRPVFRPLLNYYSSKDDLKLLGTTDVRCIPEFCVALNTIPSFGRLENTNILEAQFDLPISWVQQPLERVSISTLLPHESHVSSTTVDCMC